MSETAPVASTGRLEPLDGLRGLAALGVVVWHGLDVFYPHAIGSESLGAAAMSRFESAWLFFASIAPVGGFVNGWFAIALFFTLSGFVLWPVGGRSRHPAVPVAYRYFRLLPMVAAGSVLAYLLLAFNAYHLEEVHRLNGSTIADIHGTVDLSPVAALRQTFAGVWIGDAAEGLYDRPLWTIGLEFRASVFLLLASAVLGRMNPSKYTHLAVALLGLALIGRHYLCFAAGAWLSDCHRYDRLPAWLLKRSTLACILAGSAFAASIHPNGDGGLWIPVARHWPLWVAPYATVTLYALASVGTMLGVLHLPALRAFCGSRPSLFLGKLSYPLYVVHQPLLYSLGAYTCIVAVGAGAAYPAGVAVGMAAALAGSVALAWYLAVRIDLPLNGLTKAWIARRFETPTPPD